MLAYITGTVSFTQESSLILQVAGFGFLIFMPEGYFFAQNQAVTLYVYLHWQQDQAPTVYGFKTEAEKTIFCLLLECSGIGPKVALAVLSKLGIEQIVHAIHQEDARILSSAPGVGIKKAEQMILHLKHKVDKIAGLTYQANESSSALHDVIQALNALNYSKAEISFAINQLKHDESAQNKTFDYMLKKALAHLAK